MSTNSEPVSGGGAISDEDESERQLDLALTRLGEEHPFTVYDREGYRIWIKAVAKAVRRAAEARAEAAERERDEWVDRFVVTTTKLAAVRRVVRVAREVASEWDAVHGPWNDPHATDEETAAAESAYYDSIEALCAALAAYDAQPQPTPSPEGGA